MKISRNNNNIENNIKRITLNKLILVLIAKLVITIGKVVK